MKRRSKKGSKMPSTKRGMSTKQQNSFEILLEKYKTIFFSPKERKTLVSNSPYVCCGNTHNIHTYQILSDNFREAVRYFLLLFYIYHISCG